MTNVATILMILNVALYYMLKNMSNYKSFRKHFLFLAKKNQWQKVAGIMIAINVIMGLIIAFKDKLF